MNYTNEKKTGPAGGAPESGITDGIVGAGKKGVANTADEAPELGVTGGIVGAGKKGEAYTASWAPELGKADKKSKTGEKSKADEKNKTVKMCHPCKRIILTGGGSAGHVIPNLTLIPRLLEDNWEIHYVGGKGSIESSLIPIKEVIYHEISTGKLRRYFDARNFTDPFKVVGGAAQSFSIISKVKPTVIFSKGGYVAVPVVLAGKSRRIPIVIHESDITPGLANKISMPFARKICVSFRQTLELVPKGKGVYTGTPIRKELFEGDRKMGLSICGFEGKKPVLLITGGSLGSANINKLVRGAIYALLEVFDIAHICGKGNIDGSLSGVKGYAQFEYITEQQPHLYKAADLAVSRAGSGSIFEFLNLRMPALLIPIPRTASRGDQILNATEFEKAGYSKKLEEEEITSNDVLVDKIIETYEDRQTMIECMERDVAPDANGEILRIIYESAGITPET